MNQANQPNQPNQAVLSLLVNNSFGLLNKVSGLFSRRGYNIKSISSGETEDPRYTRITIVTEGKDQKLEQILRQVVKLEDVLTAEMFHFKEIVQRELVLIKVRVPLDPTPLQKLLEEFGAKCVLTADGCVIIELSAPDRRVNALVEQVGERFGIVEMSRTGVTALKNGGDCLQIPAQDPYAF